MSQTGIARVLAVTPQLESALAIAAAGWPVLPLHTPVDGACDCCKPACASPGKHPWTKNGLLDATTGADQIRSWWSIWPHANIGIAVPSGFVAVDVDGPEGIEALRARGYALPETYTGRLSGSGPRPRSFPRSISAAPVATSSHHPRCTAVGDGTVGSASPRTASPRRRPGSANWPEAPAPARAPPRQFRK
jgi:hypothetical protein